MLIRWYSFNIYIGTVNIFHCRVTTDISENTLILPLKVLRKGKHVASVMDIVFHPS